MRKKMMFEGKNRIYDTDKAEDLGNRAYSYYGDPAGYEETLYKTKGGLFFLWGHASSHSRAFSALPFYLFPPMWALVTAFVYRTGFENPVILGMGTNVPVHSRYT